MELILSRFVSVFAQIQATTSPYESGHPYVDEISGTTALGIKFSIAKRLLLEFCFVEEFLSFATVDVALTAGCSVLFGPVQRGRRSAMPTVPRR